MSADHSETPWKVRENGGPINGAIIEDAHGRGYFSGIVHAIQRDTHPIHGGGVSQREAEGNAAFIVRAANAHDDLVRALEWLVETCGAPGFSCNTPTLVATDVEEARAALAKAGVK